MWRLEKSPDWMRLSEAVERAGSLEALLPHLPSIRARHNGLRYWPTNEEVSGPRDIDPGLWAKALVEPDIDQAIFTMKFRLYFLFNKAGEPEALTRKVRAFNIEIECAAIDRLFPILFVCAPRHAGGRDPEHNWEDAARHVDEWVAAHGPLPRHKSGKPIVQRAAELMAEWFDKNEPPAPQEGSIRRWIRKKPRSWWGPN